MERVPPHVAAGQRLVEGEHHRVVLGVGLVAPLSDPALVVRQRVVEAPDVVAVHVLVRAPVDDPVSQLPAAAASQHHT